MRKARTNASRRICANWSIRRSASITAGSSRPPATACWRNLPAWSTRGAAPAKIQRGKADRDLDLAEERRLRFRIGVNLGDVIADADDIYGDGVNIAARLEGLAAPGSICISCTVRDHIGDRLPYAFEDMGEQSVKNITRPVRVCALRPETVAALPGLSLPPAASVSKPALVPRLSIVVLPFTDLSNDREQQYFADGITEDLTSDLSRLAGMFVISGNTAFTYRNKPVEIRQIGRELGVRYVLAGSVWRSGDRATGFASPPS
jgi:adenylate cyclase